MTVEPAGPAAVRVPKAFPALLVGFAVLYAWRMSGVLAVSPVTDHLSNFYLSGAALTLLIGPNGFRGPSRRSFALAAGAAIAAANVVMEMVVPALGLEETVNRAMGDVNTSDPVDGLFGIAAVVLVLSLVPRRQVGADG